MITLILRHKAFLVILIVALLSGNVFIGAAAASEDCRYYGHFKFDKDTNDNSRLYWMYNCGESYSGRRAGSGQNGNSCDKDDSEVVGDGGWLPNGWYDIQFMDHSYGGSVIRGRTWRLQDKRCPDGTLRSALFIHTEETDGHGQDCPTDGDDPHCWENAKDYKSVGCIKISHPNNGFPNSIGHFHQLYHDEATDGVPWDAAYVSDMVRVVP